MNFIKVYARRELTTDPLLMEFREKKDVVLYKDREARRFYCRFPWWSRSIPRRWHKTVVVNCWRWKLVWLSEEKTNCTELRRAS